MENFWAKVQKTESCWLWIASKTRGGYGKFRHGQKIVSSHRLAWELVNGPIPDGMFVLHKCDTRSCVNPDHMFLGTHQDNMNDMKSKNRQPHQPGELCGVAKLTESDVAAIYAKYAAGSITQEALGEEFGVGQDHISRILSGERWSHLRSTR